MVFIILNCNCWLTLVKYGNGASLTTHKDRYTERFSEFMLNGGIHRLQRHGLKADGNYGKIDNLHISYDGNRIRTVLEDADPVTQSGSMDYPGKKQEMAFGYNDWGALVSDESRGIESIEYDNFGNPVYFDLKGRDYTKNVYSATGIKLKTTHFTDPVAVKPPISMETPMSAAKPESTAAAVGPFEPGTQLMAGMEKLEYHGPAIYRNGKIDMVLFPGGYATVGTDKSVTFHYYTQNYLGNNRAVVNGSTGAIEQTTAYYPYGAVIPDLITGNSNQPFKFGDKELVSANELNMYDFGARLHYPAIPHFTSIDPLSEKYYWLSPYLYCANNPVNLVDLNGEIPSDYEAAIMCGYVYHDDNFKKYADALENTDWKVSTRETAIVKNRTGTFENGLQSELFERTIDGVTEYAYVYAGTNSFEDILEDVGQLFGVAPQYSSAIENAKTLVAELGDAELTFLGHSLGGSLGAASSMATGKMQLHSTERRSAL